MSSPNGKIRKPPLSVQAKRKRSHQRPGFTLLVEVIGGLVGIALLATLALAWRLSQGPIALDAFVRPIEEALSAAETSDTIDIGSAQLGWSPNWRSLVIILDNVLSRDSNGREIARSNRMEMGLSLQALLLGKLEPSRLSADGGLYSMVLRPDGSVAFGAGPPDSVANRPIQAADDDRLSALLAEAREALEENGQGARLREAKITNAQFMFLDQASRKTWSAKNIDLAIARAQNRIALRARGTLDMAGSVGSFEIAVAGASALRDARLSFTVKQAIPSRLVPRDLLGPLAGLETPIDVSASAQIDEERGLVAADANATVFAGKWNRDNAVLSVRSGALRARFDRARNQLTLSEATLDTGPFGVAMSGTLANPQALWTDGKSAINLAVTRLALPASAGFDRAVEARNVNLNGVVEGKKRLLTITSLSASLGSAKVSLAGTVLASRKPSGGSPGIAMTGAIIGTLPVRDVLAFWPRAAGPDARKWVERSVLAGDITGGKIRANFPVDLKGVPPDSALSIAFGFSRARVKYLPTLGDLTELRGTAELRGNSFVLQSPSGRMGRLVLSNADITIPKLTPGGTPATIRARMAGDAAGFAEELDRPPLSIFSAQGIKAADVSGVGALDLTISFPLLNVIPIKAIRWSIDGSFERAGLRDAFLGLDVTDARIALTGQNDLLSITGPARLGGLPLDVVWRDDRRRPTATPTVVLARGRAVEADRARLLPALTDYVTGPMGLDVRATGDGLKISGAVVIADFKESGLKTGRGNWSKPPGAPAQVSLRAFPQAGGGWSVSDIRGEGTGLSVDGRAELGRDGTLRLAMFDRLKLDGLADVALVAKRDGNTLDLDVKGPFLDLATLLAPVVRAETRAAQGALMPNITTPLRLDLNVARAVIPSGSAVTDMVLSARHNGRFFSNASLSMRSAAGLTEASLTPSSGTTRTLKASTADLPLVAKLFAPNLPLVSGKAQLEGLVPIGEATGKLTLSGQNVVVRRDDGGTWAFTKATGPLTMTGQRVVIGEGRAAGPSVGITVSGLVDLKEQRLDLRGSLVPAYGMNAALGGIPVVGGLFVSRPGEGLFAVTYSVQGPFSSAKLKTNPLSVIAPGLLRRVFEDSPAPLAPAAPKGASIPQPAEPRPSAPRPVAPSPAQ